MDTIITKRFTKEDIADLLRREYGLTKEAEKITCINLETAQALLKESQDNAEKAEFYAKRCEAIEKDRDEVRERLSVLEEELKERRRE